jgi:hypothetical protein
MAWRPHGKARVDKRNPQAFGIDDRSGFLYNLTDLKFQFEYRGNQLQNTWIRTSVKDLDIPQDQLRPRNLPPDPVPVWQPRTENYAAANAGGVPIGGTASVPNMLLNNQGDILTSDSNVILVADH